MSYFMQKRSNEYFVCYINQTIVLKSKIVREKYIPVL